MSTIISYIIPLGIILSASSLSGGEKEGIESLRIAQEYFQRDSATLLANVDLIESKMEIALANGQADSVLEWLLAMQLNSKKWMKVASDHGHPIARVMHARNLEDNGSSPEDVFALYLASAECGFSEAEERMGWYYENGKSVPIDFRQAAIWYEKAASHSSKTAIYKIAKCYQKLKNDENYRRWLERAADSGDIEAQMEAADLIIKRNEVSNITITKNFSRELDRYRAYQMYYNAALHNRNDAMVSVGKIMTEGIQSLVPKDEILGGAFLIASGDTKEYQAVILRFPIGTRENSEILERAKSIGIVVSSFPNKKIQINNFDGIDPKYLKINMK